MPAAAGCCCRRRASTCPSGGTISASARSAAHVHRPGSGLCHRSLRLSKASTERLRHQSSSAFRSAACRARHSACGAGLLRTRHKAVMEQPVCRHSQPVDLSYLASHLSSSFIPNAVVIDATASDVPPAHYLEVSTGPHPAVLVDAAAQVSQCLAAMTIAAALKLTACASVSEFKLIQGRLCVRSGWGRVSTSSPPIRSSARDLMSAISS